MTEFAKKFKHLADLELIEISEVNRDDYSNEAVLAAKNELNSRNLTFDELNNLHKEASEKARKKAERFKVKLPKIHIPKFENEASIASPDILDFESVHSSSNLRTIYVVIIVLVSFFTLFSIHFLSLLLNHGVRRIDVELLALIIIQPGIIISLPLFILKKKWGWILMNSCFASFLVLKIAAIILIINYMSNGSSMLFEQESISIYLLQVLSPIIAPIAILILLILLNRKAVREAYSISSNTRWLSMFGLSIPLIIILLRMFVF